MNNDNYKIAEHLYYLVENQVHNIGFPFGSEHPYEFKHDIYSDEQSIKLKIDLLERALEILRIEKKYLENNLPINLITKGSIQISDNSIQFVAPDKFKDSDSSRTGTRPIQLQPKLLIFLLFSHWDTSWGVYEKIERFVRAIWDEFDIVDFEKTKTGATRCFTNTRFAANTLRDYGLLKLTEQELYRTWVLSPIGIIVALKLAKDDLWRKPIKKQKTNPVLHQDIRDTFRALEDYDEFLSILTDIAKSKNLAETFKEGFQTTFELLSQYCGVLKNKEIKQKERKEGCLSILKQLEENSDVKRLFEELSECLPIGDVVKTKF